MEGKEKTISLEVAIGRAQYLCARQEKCTFDIKAKLKLWNVSSEDIEKIIGQLIKDNFISDERYAAMYVRDKVKFNKWGPIKIAQALRAKRISETIIKESLNEFGSKDNEKTITELLKKKAGSIKAKSAQDLKIKLIRFGVSRGFEYSTIISIVDKCY